jgi:isopenicillin N synthase-like dioxygenase
MCKALEDIGFCYLKNHGISEQLVCIFWCSNHLWAAKDMLLKKYV